MQNTVLKNKMVSNDTDAAKDKSMSKNNELDEVIKLCQTINSHYIELIPRPKNLLFIDDFELTQHDIVELIHSIKKRDYYSGPEIDKDPNKRHPVWIFIKKGSIYKIAIYLKLKIINNNKKIIIISLHREGDYSL